MSGEDLALGGLTRLRVRGGSDEGVMSGGCEWWMREGGRE